MQKARRKLKIKTMGGRIAIVLYGAVSYLACEFDYFGTPHNKRNQSSWSSRRTKKTASNNFLVKHIIWQRNKIIVTWFYVMIQKIVKNSLTFVRAPELE